MASAVRLKNLTRGPLSIDLGSPDKNICLASREVSRVLTDDELKSFQVQKLVATGRLRLLQAEAPKAATPPPSIPKTRKPPRMESSSDT